MNYVPLLSTLPKADMPRLRCRAHAVGHGEGHRSVVPGGGGTAPASETRQAPPQEAYRFDRAFHSMLAGLTGGISPVALSLAYIDWACHLAAAPQRQMVIAQDALQSTNKCLEAALHCFPTDQQPWSFIKPQPQDRRFSEPEWERPPFNLVAQAFLLNERWWHNATTGVRGVAPRNEAIVEFSVRQVLGACPSNRIFLDEELAS